MNISFLSNKEGGVKWHEYENSAIGDTYGEYKIFKSLPFVSKRFL